MKAKRLLTIIICSLFVLIPITVKAEVTVTPASSSIKTDETTTVSTTCSDEYTFKEYQISGSGTIDGNTVTPTGAGTITVTGVCSKEGEADETGTATIAVTEPEAPPQPEVLPLTLESISVPGATISPAFNKDTTEYSVKITDQSKFNLTRTTYRATSNSDKISVIISQLDANNVFKAIVRNTETGEKKEYKFTVKSDAANVYLSSLGVQGYKLNQTFDKTNNETNYTVTVPNNVKEIVIEATPEDSNATVTGAGKKTGLDVGGNKFTITVTNGKQKMTYKLFVTRDEDEEEENSSGDLLDSASKKKKKRRTTSTSSSAPEFDIPETEDPDSTLNMIIITFASFVLVAIGLLGIYFFFKTSPKRMKKELMKKKKKAEASPIVEIKEEKPKKVELLDDDDDLGKTKEFKR